MTDTRVFIAPLEPAQHGRGRSRNGTNASLRGEAGLSIAPPSPLWLRDIEELLVNLLSPLVFHLTRMILAPSVHRFGLGSICCMSEAAGSLATYADRAFRNIA